MHHYVIDWDKVQTLDDLKRLIAAIQISFEPNCPNIEGIKDLVRLEKKQPHQQRVVTEQAELDEKATALSNFIGHSPIFEKLDAAEQERLKEVPKESGAGVIAGAGKPFRVQIRRSQGLRVKPEAEQIDGKVFIFREGWRMDEDDTSLYVGEVAMIPNDFDWPADAPAWVASGDLVPSNAEVKGGRDEQ